MHLVHFHCESVPYTLYLYMKQEREQVIGGGDDDCDVSKSDTCREVLPYRLELLTGIMIVSVCLPLVTDMPQRQPQDTYGTHHAWIRGLGKERYKLSERCVTFIGKKEHKRGSKCRIVKD